MHNSNSNTPLERAGTIRILVIDDHPVSRLLLRGQLERLGWDADFVENGLLALHQFAHCSYQAVLTDLHMPVLDGITLAIRLRGQGVTVPIIAMSASADEETQQRCADAGIDQLLTKPLLPAELDAAIRSHLTGPKRTNTLEQQTQRPQSFYAAMTTTSNESLARLGAALQSNQKEAALEELHFLKGGFMFAQMREVASACMKLEKLLLSGEYNEAQAAFVGLQRATTAALRAANFEEPLL